MKINLKEQCTDKEMRVNITLNRACFKGLKWDYVSHLIYEFGIDLIDQLLYYFEYEEFRLGVKFQIDKQSFEETLKEFWEVRKQNERMD